MGALRFGRAHGLVRTVSCEVKPIAPWAITASVWRLLSLFRQTHTFRQNSQTETCYPENCRILQPFSA
ncbi:hypothetical protein C6499_17135 [Candidatus Poribacteria bacterium]|nr:MAG: hypothetical protein C6499_17135 [Candidatus Poribacteria bacterium]